MPALIKFESLTEALAEKVHNLGADALKLMLSNTAPVSTNTVKVNITEIAAGNGYTAGGAALTISSSAQTSGTYKLVLADVVFTATGAVGPFRYGVIYNSTATNGELVGYIDYGSSVSLINGETFTFDFDATNGVLTIG